MFNASNESIPLGDAPAREEIRSKTQAQTPQTINFQTLTPEEIKEYKDCAFSMYYKAGIPFATVFHVFSYLRNPGTNLIPRSLNRSVFVFFGNVILGSLFFSPMCYVKLLSKHAEIEKRKKEMKGENLSLGEASFPTLQSEDFSYPSDLVSSLNEPESNFSSDFNPLISLIDEKEERKTPSTTYQDLRKRHRSNSTNKEFPSPLNIDQDRGPSTLATPSPLETSTFNEPPPRRIVKKNKYGDEME